WCSRYQTASSRSSWSTRRSAAHASCVHEMSGGGWRIGIGATVSDRLSKNYSLWSCLIAATAPFGSPTLGENGARGYWSGGISMRAALYARVSRRDQKTLPAQVAAMRSYTRKRRWTVGLEVQDIGSGARDREKRQDLLAAA